jgi:hypothetical protein
MSNSYESFRNAMADIAESWYAQSMHDDSDVDQADDPDVVISESVIDGLGAFCNVVSGFPTERIVALIVGHSRTRAGRYINHDSVPNCEAVVLGGCLWARTLRDIEHGEELTIDYFKTESARMQLADELADAHDAGDYA